jgi:hypothetical protein
MSNSLIDVLNKESREKAAADAGDADNRRRILALAADMQRDAVMKSIANRAVKEASRELDMGGPHAVAAAYAVLERVAVRYGRLLRSSTDRRDGSDGR